jgi:hypothetical protein
MDWIRVVAHLRLLSGYHHSETSRWDRMSGYHELAKQNRLLAELFNGLAAALEGGMDEQRYEAALKATKERAVVEQQAMQQGLGLQNYQGFRMWP